MEALWQYLIGVSQGIVGNLLTIALLLGLGWLVILLRIHQLQSFFGIKKGRRLLIYTSTLLVPAGGSVGSDGNPRSYDGPAVPLSG